MPAIAFFVLSLAELVLIVQVASAIGAVPTLLLMILLSAVGAWVVKHEGLGAWRRILESLSVGRMPTGALIDGCLVLLSGVMLLTPGFITAAGGLVLAVPPVRAMAHRATIAAVNHRVARRVRVVGERHGGSTRSAPGFHWAQAGGGGFGDRGRPERVEEFIDLEAEEVFIDGPLGELEPPDQQIR